MVIVIPSQAACEDLDDFLGKEKPWYHLYVNNLTITYATVLGDFVEASFPGYSAERAVAWTPSIWTGETAISYADAIVWTLTEDISPVSIYGYYATMGPAGHLAWCEKRLDGPIVLQHMGDPVALLPTLSLCQCVVPAVVGGIWPYPRVPDKQLEFCRGGQG